MIKIEDYKIFADNISTLKETSKDKNNNESEEFMTSSKLEAINFDGVKDDYIKNLHLKENPRSNDALFITDKGHPIFIEFKNGYMDNKKEFDVRGKIYDSMSIFTDIVNKGISFTREHLDYILVYNEKKNSKSEIVTHIAKKAKTEHIKYGLERFKKFFFKEVHTYTEKEFEEYLTKFNM